MVYPKPVWPIFGELAAILCGVLESNKPFKTGNSVLLGGETVEGIKRRYNALILAHNYQIPEIQEIADYVGDSLELSCKAAESNKDVIVFCGVKFMAETAKILSPEKTILLPAAGAGCPLADKADVEELRKVKSLYPGAAVVCYVNSSAEIKAESDICCTSSNAAAIVNSLEEEEIIFVPDGNLARWVAGQTDKKIIPWEGNCPIHNRVLISDIHRMKKAAPDAEILVHPECSPEVIDAADLAASTSGIIRYSRESDKKRFIIGTEVGILHRLQEQSPEKEFFILSPGLVCPDMKLTADVDMVRNCLENKTPEIDVQEDIRVKAFNAVSKMLEII
ncbi:MAG: quinolinate synthase NadA [Clostridia bacterium]|nr:quinolinate synthase NadA [Clostridia bacterium]